MALPAWTDVPHFGVPAGLCLTLGTHSPDGSCPHHYSVTAVVSPHDLV